MSVTIGLKLDLPGEAIEGKAPIIFLGRPGARALLLECATRLEQYAAQQLEELRFHKDQLDKNGAADKEVAASLISLHALADRALDDAATLRAAIASTVELTHVTRDEGNTK